MRVFAGQIELPPAEYAEVEAGIVRGIGKAQEALIPQVLGLGSSRSGSYEWVGVGLDTVDGERQRVVSR